MPGILMRLLLNAGQSKQGFCLEHLVFYLAESNFQVLFFKGDRSGIDSYSVSVEGVTEQI